MPDGPAPRPERSPVYDSDLGRICPSCGKPVKGCVCQAKKVIPQAGPKNDGVVRVSRDRRNRHGKTVTVVTGVPGHPAAVEDLATKLKRLCGSGGTVKEGVIEIQGDHRDLVLSKLLEMGYKAKLAGG
ncbi:MAG: translation initiation factor Sui1 [Sphingomonadaceae bacterium]